MCINCFAEYGGPLPKTPAIEAAAAAIARVYTHSAVGGGLHVVLDDWNVEDEYLDARSASGGDSREQVADEEACLALLRALSVRERANALAIFDFDGFDIVAV